MLKKRHNQLELYKLHVFHSNFVFKIRIGLLISEPELIDLSFVKSGVLHSMNTDPVKW